MAESEDIRSGSEEVYNKICMVCHEDRKLKKAEGYCKNCKEYLCKDCIHSHQSVRITRSHEIIVVTDDIDNIVGQFADASLDEDVCLDHGKAPIDKFCKDHAEVGCHHCMTLKHNKCETEEIDAMVNSFNDSMLSARLLELQEIRYGFSKSNDSNTKSDDKAIQEYKNYIEKQNRQRKTLISQIEMVQMKDRAKQAAILNEYLSNSKLKRKSISNTSKTINALMNQCIEIQQSTNFRQKYITHNKLEKQIPLLKTVLEESSDINTALPFKIFTKEEMVVCTRGKEDWNVSGVYRFEDYKDLMIPFQHFKLDPPSGQDTIVKNGRTTNIDTKHICMTAMKQHENRSLEELRHEWYTEFIDQNKKLLKLFPVSAINHGDGVLRAGQHHHYKLLLVGDWNAGKSTFIRRNISGNTSKDFKESMGVNVYPTTLHTTSGHVTFDVWDTCGQERLADLRDGFYKHGECAIIMFDISTPASASSVSKWYDTIKQHCGYIPTVVCGNKVDMASKHNKDTNTSELKSLELPVLKIQLISGKTMTNFEAPFLPLAQALTSNYSMEIETKCSLYPVMQADLDPRIPLKTNVQTNDDEEDL